MTNLRLQNGVDNCSVEAFVDQGKPSTDEAASTETASTETKVSAEQLSPRLDSYHPSVNSISKRLIDIGISLIGLLILVIIFLPIAIAIKLDSSGPILYRQERCGLKGKRFKMYKFRTMVNGAEQLKKLVKNEAEGPIFKSKSDPRITRVGRFLRRSSLDEFPQFWNVLLGEMSLVGTRPPTPDEVSHYSEEHWRRLDVKPGLTGEWQVSGRSHISNFEDIFSLDMKYQHQWTPARDLMIIAKTVLVVLRGVGSY